MFCESKHATEFPVHEEKQNSGWIMLSLFLQGLQLARTLSCHVPACQSALHPADAIPL